MFLEACAMEQASATLHIIDSPGGLVTEATAIRVAVLNAQKAGVHVTALIQNRCHSAAALVAMAADCVIARPSATWVVHGSRFLDSGLTGTADEIERTVRFMRSTDDVFAEIIEAHTGLPRRQVAALLAEDRVMDVTEATRLGFIHHILDEGELLLPE